ncbi:hypothetical protein [Sporichthya polymorpha]|uniref:hypothetical protein n=1 Tax=Sporichthya polymorpha TaxID=35751 RepID=UPI000362BD41|nr:hypothetical protein [Sporichthya polymorpha]
MTSGENEILARLTAVEHEASAARQLAAAAYEEVGSLAAGVRANTSLLNALRETQIEQGRRLSGVEGRLSGVEGRLSGVEGRLSGVEGRLDILESEVRTGFATMGQGMATIVAMLDRITPES